MDARPWLSSYAEGVPETLRYPDRPLPWLLEEAAGRFGGAPAASLWLPGARFARTMTYRALKREVDRFSAGAAGLGVRKGDRIGLILPNCPQYIVAYFGTLQIGAIVVGNNPMYTERELAAQLRDAGVEVVVTLDVLYPKVAAVRDEVGLREVIVARVTDYLPLLLRGMARRKQAATERRSGRPWPPVPGGARVRLWRELMGGSRPPPTVPLEPDDLAAIVYTGGTTGPPKGAMLTHANLLANAFQAAAWFPEYRDGSESVLCIVPFFHAYGMTVAMNFAIRKAAKMVILPKFDLPTVVTAIERERPGLFPGVPRIYQAIVDSEDARGSDLRSIQACISGAGPLSVSLADAFNRLTGATIVEGYGLTEMSPISHGNPIDDSPRRGTIGVPLPDTGCRIVDPNDWTREVPIGSRGELVLSGPQLMQGYLHHEDETAAVIRTDAHGVRWLLTGDIATMDADGYVRLVDRKKDIVIVSGFKVYPTEVEQVLLGHPSVAQVCVAGVPDDRTGEAVKAFVVLRAGKTASAEDILAFCRDPVNGLTGYRVPASIQFRDSLPVNMTGKVLRRALVQEDARAKEEVRS